MSEKSTLRIHAQIMPEDTQTASAGTEKKAKTIRWKSVPIPKAEKAERKRSQTAAKARRPRARLGFSDRLLRNSSIACAILLGILALGNINQPWAEKATAGIEQALTMHIDLDDSIGDLTFVREIMPESALVFLNISGDSELTAPVSGEISHPWSNVQPWVMFNCASESPVYAANAGTVTAVSPLSDGRVGLLIDHGNGLESVYAYLQSVDVQSGDTVERGQQVGVSEDSLYFEWRNAGESVDPTELMGL